MTLDPAEDSQVEVPRKEVLRRAAQLQPERTPEGPNNQKTQKRTPTTTPGSTGPTSNEKLSTDSQEAASSTRSARSVAKKLSFEEKNREDSIVPAQGPPKKKQKQLALEAPPTMPALEGPHVPNTATQKAAPKANTVPAIPDTKPTAAPKAAAAPKPKVAPKATAAKAKAVAKVADEPAAEAKNALTPPEHKGGDAKCAKQPAKVEIKRSGSAGVASILGRQSTEEKLASPRPEVSPTEQLGKLQEYKEKGEAGKDEGKKEGKRRKRDAAAHARRNRFYRTLSSQGLRDIDLALQV